MFTVERNSQRGRPPGLWLFGLWLLVAALPVAAHEIRPAVADIRLDPDGGFQISVRLNLEALLAGIGETHSDSDDSVNAADYDRLRALPPTALASRFDDFAPTLLAAIQLRAGAGALPLALREVDVAPVGDTALARYSTILLEGRLPAGTSDLSWQWPPAFGAIVVRVDSASDGELYSGYLQAGERSAVVDLRNPVARSGWEVFLDYIGVGFEHIVPKGLDHILFVVGLFLLSPRWQALLWQVSAFTLAHTITLGMSMMGWVSLPSSIVEPLIAASIVYICVENLYRRRLTPWRPLLVFAFGLLHGLGFASVLTGFGLSPAHFVAGLVGFNLGVELGQLAVLAACFLAVGAWFRHQPWYRRRITIPASMVIAFIGSFWFVERTVLA